MYEGLFGSNFPGVKFLTVTFWGKCSERDMSGGLFWRNFGGGRFFMGRNVRQMSVDEIAYSISSVS